MNLQAKLAEARLISGAGRENAQKVQRETINRKQTKMNLSNSSSLRRRQFGQ